MDYIFELLLEIIMEPIIEGYAFAMMRFADKNKKVDKGKVKCFVVFECIVLMISFIAGGIMLFETNGSSLWGKVMFISSITVSVLQIVIGSVLRKVTKEK